MTTEEAFVDEALNKSTLSKMKKGMSTRMIYISRNLSRQGVGVVIQHL